MPRKTTPEIRSGSVRTGYEPHPWQVEIHKNLKRFSVVICHRRFGKTVMAINTLIDAALRSKRPNSRYAYIAPLLKQAKELVWDYLNRYVGAISGVERNETELWIKLPNGSRIRLYGADSPDALRGGYFDGIVLDEIADMKPNVWGEILRPALADRKGWALFIGTPRGMNQLYEMFQRARRDPEWYADVFDCERTKGLPWLEDKELQTLKENMSDAQYRQEMMCDFTASVENVMIPIDMVHAARARALQPQSYGMMPRVLGIDVARFGDDFSVLCRRQGLLCSGFSRKRNNDLMHFASMAAHEINDWKPEAVFVDACGLGAGVVDRLRQLGFAVIGVNSSGAPNNPMYFNKRAEMWGSMREWIKEGGSIPNDVDLESELTATTFSYTNGDRLQLERKEDMKKRGIGSPDIADALALTFAEPVFKRHPLEDFMARAERLQTEYDLFATPQHETNRCKLETSVFGGV